jgi:thioesterase DpgC
VTVIDTNPAAADLQSAAAAVADRVAERERALAALPIPSRRGADQRELAARLRFEIRMTRQQFLDEHAESLYDALTESRARRPRLRELLRTTAERFPSVVPDEDRMSEEDGRAQADKETWEIDQGIFFRALLRSPVAGGHLQETLLAVTDRARRLVDGFRATDRVDLGSVLLERRGEAAHVTVNNQHCLNAEDNRLIADMETAVDLVALHPHAKVGVLRGGVMTHPKYAGRRVFSAGLNLQELHAGRISFVDFLLGREMGYVSKILHGVLDDPDAAAWPDSSICVPWVAVIDSFAIGGGMQMLTVVDRVIAADDAYFSLPAAQEGIVPGLASLRLGRLAGGRLVRQLILGGRRLCATEPDARFLVDEVVSPQGLEEAVTRAVAELATPAVAANRRMIANAEEPLDVLRRYLAEYALTQALRLHDVDVLHKVGRFSSGLGS